MNTLKVHNIEPATGTDVALGAAGDSITVSGDSLKLNTFKDAGGNTLFTSDGAGTVSSVNSGLKGTGPILISSQTASNSASISFTSGIDSTYDKYMFVFVNMHPSASNPDFYWIASTDGGSSYGVATTTTMFRATHHENGTGGALAYQTGRDSAQNTNNIHLTGNAGNDADQSASGEFHLYSPSSTTYVKHYTAGVNSLQTGAGFFYRWYSAGYINTTSAVTGIKFLCSSGNIDAGTIKMYGIG